MYFSVSQFARRSAQWTCFDLSPSQRESRLRLRKGRERESGGGTNLIPLPEQLITSTISGKDVVELIVEPVGDAPTVDRTSVCCAAA